MKLGNKLIALFVAVVMACSPAFASGDVVSGIRHAYHWTHTHPTQTAAMESSTDCALGIYFSANTAAAASVGLPVLAVGNFLSYELRNAKATPYQPNVDAVTFFHNAGRYLKTHPSLIADASGAFCSAFAATRNGHRVYQAKNHPTPQPPPCTNDVSCTPGGGPVPPTPVPPGQTPPPPPVTPPGPPVTPPGPPTPPPPTPPPTHGGPCIQDCGFPGNGGVNGGNDLKKPPFPGKGRNH